MSVEVSKLFDDGNSLSVERGQSLFFAGDRIRSMYLVNGGQIDLVRHTCAGDRMILQRVLPGAVLAEASAYSETYHCDGTARVPSEVRAIPVTVFRQRLGGDVVASAAWAAHLAYGLQSARMRAEVRTLRTVAERLDAWLGAEQRLPPKGQWQELAQTLGVSREALYRELAKRRAPTRSRS